jgi:heat-inducible transcriptional repressor
VFIGHEVPDPELQDLSLVTASYAVDGEKGWGLGVLGSTRMEYARIVSVVDHVARVVAQALQEMHR